MKIESVSKTTNLVVIVMIAVFISLPAMIIYTNLNLKNASPDRFLAVQIDGEPKIREVYVQEKPTENPEAMKLWVKNSVVNFYNYDANNFIQTIKDGKHLFTEDYYPTFSVATALRIKENVAKGWYVASSIVEMEPILVQQGVIDGDSYYKFYMKIITYNKSELSTIPKTTKLFVTVKFENPEQNVRSIAIADISIVN